MEGRTTIRKFLSGVYYSLPVQLVVIQLRNHKALLVFWLVLYLFITNNLGSDYGIPFLFLEPEYLGEVSFYSLFLLGLGVGTFIAAYQIAMYILDSYRFHFLALEDSPFFVYFLNNSLLPFLFLILYSEEFIYFQVYSMQGFRWLILWRLFGMLLGMVLILLLMSLYFFKTNKNLVKVFGKSFVKELRTERAIIGKAKAGLSIRHRVDYFFSGIFKIKHVDKSIPADFRTMVQVLNQNHGNALFLELLLLVVIVVLGLMEYNPFFQIPAALSILLLFSIALMLIAAFTFWFRKIGLLSLLLAGALWFAVDYSGYFEQRHPAFGMNYEAEPAEYTANRLHEITAGHILQADHLETTRILDRWKSDYRLFHLNESRPKAVFVCASGGGLRAAYFTFRSLQRLDSLTGGEFMDHTRLMTGASGGMIGSAYFRELHLRRQLGMLDSIHSRKLAEPIAEDLLNRVSYKIVTGLFLPNLNVQVGNGNYPGDRGYSFDDQLRVNLGMFYDKRLGDYARPEEEALIPMMILTPVVVNDGRRMYISATNASYMSRMPGGSSSPSAGITGIEFMRFFDGQMADSLLWVTALRMNASFPLITPYVQLPSDPVLRVMDAGVVDNFGIQTTLKFLYVFREWFAKNTSEVMILQIRDTEKHTIPTKGEMEQRLARSLDPFAATYNSYARSKELATEVELDYAASWYNGKIRVVDLEYAAEDSAAIPASLNWHLTDREKLHIDAALDFERNRERFEEVRKWLEK